MRNTAQYPISTIEIGVAISKAQGLLLDMDQVGSIDALALSLTWKFILENILSFDEFLLREQRNN